MSLFSGDSRDEYIPSAEDSEDSPDSSPNLSLRNTTAICNQTESASVSTLPVEEHPSKVWTYQPNTSQIEVNEINMSDEELEVEDTSKSTLVTKSKRVWDKKYSCFYCKRLVAKLPHHLILKHKQEDVVKQIITLPKGSKERQQILFTIRNKGKYLTM